MSTPAARPLVVTALALAGLAVPAAAPAHAGPAAPPPAAIIDGTVVDDAPFAAALVKGGSRLNCSGSLLSADWVLTAKHCVGATGPTTDLSVRIGKARYAEGELVKVVSQTVRYDLAVLKLERPATTGTPVKLAAADPPVGGETELYGWGATCRSGCSVSPQLKTAKVRVDSVDAKDGQGGPAIKSSRITGLAWKGDSGGPQFYQGTQVGVCSQGDGQSWQTYGSVAQSREWIRSVTGL